MTQLRRNVALGGAGLAAFLALGAGQALADTTAQVNAGTLQVVGDNAADKILLTPDPADPASLVVDVGEDGTVDFRFDRSTISAVDVEGRGGDDELRVDRDLAVPVTIDGGNGDDTLTGGDGAETLIGGNGQDFVDGNRGSDVAQLGGGKDTFQWDPGDGSDTVDGQGGGDVLAFNGSNANEKIDVTPNGSRVRLSRDVAAITMDLSGVERLSLRTLGGVDAVTVADMSGTGFKAADVDLSSSLGTGDGAADTVTALGTDGPDRVNVDSADGATTVSGLASKLSVTGAEAANDDVGVKALGGADEINGGVGLAGPRGINVDGGPDADTMTYRGTAGDDVIGIANNGVGVAAVFAPGGSPMNASNVESTVVQGLAGADQITGQNGIAAATHLTIDGDSGDDTIAGGDGDDTLIGGSGDDLVDGNRGVDTAQLGGGDDRFQWDPGDGSDVVEGQGGTDAMQFNGSNANEKIDVESNGSRVTLTRDVGAITMDFGGIERLAVRALGGADAVTIGDLSGTPLKAADVDLSATFGGGDGAADSVSTFGTSRADKVAVTRSGAQVLVDGLPTTTTISGGEPALDTLRVATLGGNDRVTVAPDVSGLIAPVVDLGADQK